MSVVLFRPLFCPFIAHTYIDIVHKNTLSPALSAVFLSEERWKWRKTSRLQKDEEFFVSLRSLLAVAALAVAALAVSLAFGAIKAIDDHEDTPKDGPDPTNEGQNKLQDTNDDVRHVVISRTGDDGAETIEEEVQDAAHDAEHPAAGSLQAGDAPNHVVAKSHVVPHVKHAQK